MPTFEKRPDTIEAYQFLEEKIHELPVNIQSAIGYKEEFGKDNFSYYYIKGDYVVKTPTDDTKVRYHEGGICLEGRLINNGDWIVVDNFPYNFYHIIQILHNKTFQQMYREVMKEI